MNNNFRPVYEQPIYKIIIPVCDLSLDKAIPQFAAAIDAQIDCDDASEDFKKKKLHSNIRSSSTDSMTRPYRGGLVYKRTRSFPPPATMRSCYRSSTQPHSSVSCSSSSPHSSSVSWHFSSASSRAKKSKRPFTSAHRNSRAPSSVAWQSRPDRHQSVAVGLGGAHEPGNLDLAGRLLLAEERNLRTFGGAAVTASGMHERDECK